MPAMDKTENYEKAKKRAEVKLGFYIHAAVYAIVNVILMVVDLTTSPGKIWFIWPLLGWGAGLLAHAALVYFSVSNNKVKARMIKSELDDETS